MGQTNMAESKWVVAALQFVQDHPEKMRELKEFTNNAKVRKPTFNKNFTCMKIVLHHKGTEIFFEFGPDDYYMQSHAVVPCLRRFLLLNDWIELNRQKLASNMALGELLFPADRAREMGAKIDEALQVLAVKRKKYLIQAEIKRATTALMKARALGASLHQIRIPARRVLDSESVLVVHEA